MVRTGSWWKRPIRPACGRSCTNPCAASGSEASAVQDCYEISLELPGVEADAIDVSVEDGHLTVKGEKRIEREEKGRTYFFSEREYGAFQRSFRLPLDVQADDITADFKNGVLTLKVPKAGPPKEKTQRIQIRSS
jgi:HSP20 family protein